MSLVLALGSNLGDRKNYLSQALEKLQESFSLIHQSRVYESIPIEYENQPDFLNQVVEFESPQIDPHQTLKVILAVEAQLGRHRLIPKGPRVIDIDIIFFDFQIINSPHLSVPHPQWSRRSFVFLPLQELPFWMKLQQNNSEKD